jgi:hypothetical protein
VRELDVLLNGEEGAAKQASLCDIVAQLRRDRQARGEPVAHASASGEAVDLCQAINEEADFIDRTREMLSKWLAKMEASNWKVNGSGGPDELTLNALHLCASRLRSLAIPVNGLNPHVGHEALADAWQQGFEGKGYGWSRLTLEEYKAVYAQGEQARALKSSRATPQPQQIPDGYKQTVKEFFVALDAAIDLDKSNSTRSSKPKGTLTERVTAWGEVNRLRAMLEAAPGARAASQHHRAAYEEGWTNALQGNNPRYRRQVRNEALDEAAKAVANHNLQGREWVRGSLFDTLANEAAARIRQLKSEPLKD